MMKRLLYVGAFVPNENGAHAGARAAFNNLSILRQIYSQIDIIICTTESEATTANEMQIIFQSVASFLSGLLTYRNYFTVSDFLVSHILHARVNRHFITAISAAMNVNDYDEIFADFTQVIKPALIARSFSGKSMPISGCLHDIYAQKFMRLPGLYSRLIHGVLIGSEKSTLEKMDKLLLLNEKDGYIVRNFYSLKQTSIVEFTPPSWSKSVERPALQGRTVKLLCYGNFNRRENSESTLLLIREIFPTIRRAFPDCLLQLLGTGSLEFHKANSLPDTVVPLGFIADPSPVFSECACVLVPLTMGAGVKFKVLDALSAGVPVIGTGIAFEGIDARDLMIEASISEFAAAVIQFLNRISNSKSIIND